MNKKLASRVLLCAMISFASLTEVKATSIPAEKSVSKPKLDLDGRYRCQMSNEISKWIEGDRRYMAIPSEKKFTSISQDSDDGTLYVTLSGGNIYSAWINEPIYAVNMMDENGDFSVLASSGSYSIGDGLEDGYTREKDEDGNLFESYLITLHGGFDVSGDVQFKNSIINVVKLVLGLNEENNEWVSLYCRKPAQIYISP